MKYLDLILTIFTIVVNLLVFILCYKKTLKKNIIFSFVNYLEMIVVSILNVVLNIYLNTTYKVFLLIIIIFIIYKIIYKENNITTFIKTIFIYVMMIISDFLSSIIIILFTNITSFLELSNIGTIKSINTLLGSIILLTLFSIRFINKNIKRLIEYLSKKVNPIFIMLLLLSLISIYSISYFSSYDFTIYSFTVAITLIILFSIFCTIIIYFYFKNKDKMKEQQDLLDLMKEYEVLLEKDKINRHEILNNLVVIKSFKNKASKEYEKLLDDIIKDYQLRKTNTISKVYNLPSGIKGVVSYKLKLIMNNKINFKTLISSDIDKKIDALDSKTYYKLCKIMGILLDNAIEACSKTKEKRLLINIYDEEDICIYIENSFNNNNLDLKKIIKKGFSSKGENRGYGLYIVKNLIKNKKNIKLEQSVDGNSFISILTIKNAK